MRIAIYHNLPTGGGKRALYELVSRTNKDIEYDIYCIANDTDQKMFDIQPLVKNTYKYVLDKSNSKLPSGLRQRKKIKALINLQKAIAIDIDKNNYDAVFVNSCKETHSPVILQHLKTPSLYFLQEPRRPSFEYNLMPHRIEDSSKGPVRFKKKMSRFLLYDYLRKLDIESVRMADKILCNSYFSMESIARAYGKYATVCYLGVDDTVFNLKENINKKDSVISVGALHPNKGHSLIVRSIALLDNKPDLNIVYDREVGGYKKELLELSKDLGVNLKLHYQISDKQLAELYRLAKATVCAAELEPFGFTPIESMACGTPVVAVKEGGYRETITDSSGVFAQRDSQSIADAISKVLKSTHYYDRAKEISANTLKNWSWQNSIELYKKSIQDLINNEQK